MNKKVSLLHNLMKKMLLERADFAHGYGIYDRPGPDDNDLVVGSDMSPETTLGEEVPVNSSEMMASQLADDAPPVDDPDYSPSNSVELGRAANLISKNVPDDQIEKYYRSLHSLLDTVIEKSNESSIEEEEEDKNLPVETPPKEKEENVKEESIRRSIRKILEQGSKPLYGYESDDPEYGDETPEIDWMGDEGETPPMTSSAEDTPGEGSSLEDVASEFGYSSPSGARQDIGRISKKAEFLVNNMPESAISSLKNYAAGEFMAQLGEGGYLDEEDIKELSENPAELTSLDSFRFFFMAAFVMPAYRELLKNSKKEIQTKIEKMGLPKKAQQSVLNQALGDVPKSMPKLVAKINKSASEEGMSPEDIKKAVSSLQKGFGDLEKSAEISGDLSAQSRSKWDGASNSKKQKLLRQAMDQTNEFQGM